jgi:hypothetical protein
LKIKSLTPRFVANLPEPLEEGVLYVSEEFQIAGHKCCCGCGEEVITPLNKARWRVIKAGDKVSLYPSIGNWKYVCRSHYWIRQNQVIDALPMSKESIKLVEERDRLDKQRYLSTLARAQTDHQQQTSDAGQSQGLLAQIVAWFRTLWR